MKKTRSILIAVLALCVLMPAAADDYSSIMIRAREGSRMLETNELNRESSQIMKKEYESPKETVWTVSGSVMPFSMHDVSKDAFNITSLYVQAVLPNDGNTAIALHSPMRIGYDGSYSISPSLDASHTFHLGKEEEKDTLIEDLNEAKNDLASDVSYMKAKYSFDKSVISQMQSLLRTEKSIFSSEHQIANSERNLSDSLELGRMTEGSIEWQRNARSIEKSRKSLENLYAQYEDQKDDWKELTGMEWNGVENIPLYDIEVKVLDGGNSQVVIKSMESEISEHQLATFGIEPPKAETIKLSGSVGGSIYNEKAGGRDSMSASIGLDYNAETWNVKTDFSLSGTSIDTLRPSLTISGRWSSAPAMGKGAKTRSDEDELRRREIEAEKAENAYKDALLKYEEDAHDLEGRIDDWQWRMSDHMSELEFLESELEFERSLFDEGFSTERKVAEAEYDLELARKDTDILKLEGVALAYDAASFAL